MSPETYNVWQVQYRPEFEIAAIMKRAIPFVFFERTLKDFLVFLFIKRPLLKERESQQCSQAPPSVAPIPSKHFPIWYIFIFSLQQADNNFPHHGSNATRSFATPDDINARLESCNDRQDTGFKPHRTSIFVLYFNA